MRSLRLPHPRQVPVPKYFIEDRAKELDDRDKFLEVCWLVV